MATPIGITKNLNRRSCSSRRQLVEVLAGDLVIEAAPAEAARLVLSCRGTHQERPILTHRRRLE